MQYFIAMRGRGAGTAAVDGDGFDSAMVVVVVAGCLV